MRTISAQEITDTVARLCIEANTRLPQDVQAALDKARQEEPWPLAKNTLDLLWSNLSAAREKDLPICQDTGMACVFVELGTDVHIDGSFEAAIHEGVRRGYTDGYLRKSIVADPLRRGGSFDKVAYLAKKALLRPLDVPNPDPYYADLERELLTAINELGIGPQGFGGQTTCLGLAIEQMPTHVAGLPVAVNVSCHVTRRASAEL